MDGDFSTLPKQVTGLRSTKRDGSGKRKESLLETSWSTIGHTLDIQVVKDE